MADASKSDVAGTKVSGATNVAGGADAQNGAVAGLADDIASINAANANRVPIARGTATSAGRIYNAGPAGFKDGGF